MKPLSLPFPSLLCECLSLSSLLSFLAYFINEGVCESEGLSPLLTFLSFLHLVGNYLD